MALDTLATARRLVEEVSREQPQAFELACLASFAVRVDPPFLRRLRLDLLPGTSPALEADVWLGDLVAFRSPQGIVFAKRVGSLLRERLAATGAERYEKVWRMTEESHRWLSPVLRVEEELNYLQFCRAPDAHERTRILLRSALAALVRDPESGLGHWAAGASERLPPELRYLEEGQGLAEAARLSLGEGLTLPAPPSGEMPGWLEPMARGRLKRVRLGVKLFTGYVELSLEAQTPGPSIELPRTDPLVVDIEELAEKPPTPRRVFISYSRRADAKWQEEIARTLRSAHHKALGEDAFKPGESLLSVVQDKIRKSDAAILLISELALESQWDFMEARALLEKKHMEGDRFTLLPVYLGSANPSMLARSWPGAEEFLSIQGIYESRTGDLNLSRAILEALEQPSETVRSWRRVELRPTQPERIALQRGHVRLRTLLGDEHVIEPLETGALLRMSPPDPVFVGYEQTFERALQVILKTSSILFIHGHSGAGKTEFVRRIAHFSADSFPDGMFYVERREGTPPFSARAVASHVLAALNVEMGNDSRGVIARYRELASKLRFLLVLDGLTGASAEHDLPAAELESLVPRLGSGSRLILTARQPAHWANFSTRVSIHSLELKGLESEAATVLLRAVAPHVLGDEAVRLAQACGYLPGPLRRVAEALTRQEPDVSLSNYASLLERARMLSVFPESFDLEAARTVLGLQTTVADTAAQVPTPASPEAQESALQEMVHLGVVQPTAVTGRFILWHPVRQVVKAYPDQRGLERAEHRHTNHFAHVLEALNTLYRMGGVARAAAIEAFDRDWPNIAVAFSWKGNLRSRFSETLFHRQGQYPFGAGPLMRLRRPPGEREQLYQRRLRSITYNRAGYADTMFGLALALADLGKHEEALQAFRTTMETANSAVASTLTPNEIRTELAMMYVDLGRHEEIQSISASLATEEPSLSPSQRARACIVSAWIQFGAGLNTTIQEFQAARRLAQDAADVRLEVGALLGLANVEMERGSLGEAEARYIEALEFAEAFRDERGFALASWGFGRLRALQGNRKAARELMQRLVDYHRSIGHAQAEWTAQQMELHL